MNSNITPSNEQPSNEYNTSSPSNQVFVQNIIQERRSNGLGTAGFILSIVALVTGWIPVLGWIIWFLGALLSVVGVFRKPRILAIIGVCISFFWVIIFTLVIGAVVSAGAVS